MQRASDGVPNPSWEHLRREAGKAVKTEDQDIYWDIYISSIWKGNYSHEILTVALPKQDLNNHKTSDITATWIGELSRSPTPKERAIDNEWQMREENGQSPREELPNQLSDTRGPTLKAYIYMSKTEQIQ